MTNFTTLALTEIPDYNFDKNFDNLTNASFNLSNLTSVGASTYTDVLGSLFWGVIFAIIFIMIWIRQEDVTIPSLLGLIIGSSIWYLMPEDWVSMAMSLTIVSFAGLMYSLLKGRN